MPKRLSLASLTQPLAYDRARVRVGMVHLGIGAFHRAHVAAYVDDILTFDPQWGIVGASLRRPETRDALAPQDFLYTHLTRSGEGTRARIIGSLVDVLDASTQRAALLASLSNPAISIVSLTVTEKGYCHDPAMGQLDETHADIQRDLKNPDAPVSVPGLLVRALEARRLQNIAPFTVLCCDNLPTNGATVARVVAGFARLRDRDLASFIADRVAFPSTMVDRIVPATTDEDRHLARAMTGLEDAWPVATEPFSQWVIEDSFPAGRPDFARVGVQMVSDVKPFEHMKLRMLNGSHSTLAYLGYLAGHEYVNQAIADPPFRQLIHGLMTEEVIATLPPEVGDLSGYRNALLERFANPALKHRTWQIAMDGSQKLPQRLLGTIRDRLARGLPITRLALGVAGWMRYVTGVDEQGKPIDVRDPLGARLRAIADAAGQDAGKLVHGLLQVKDVFGEDLSQQPCFVEELTRHVSSLFGKGARVTAERVVTERT